MGDTESKASYSHVLKYTGIFGSVQGLNIVIGLVRNKLVALLLGPAGMGLVSLLNSTITFMSQATSLGISFSAVKHISEIFDSGDEERIAHYIKVVRTWCLITALLGMLLCAMLGPVLSNYSFAWGDHTLEFILLAPVVGMLAITGGETAILKGARKLRALASIQVCSVFAALFISVPIYFFFGTKGIVPVLLLVALADMTFTVMRSYHYYPLNLRGCRSSIGEGTPMVRLGVAFVLTGIMGSGAEMVIRSFLNVSAGLDFVGLYNAGYVLTVTYAGMVFTAMETDYFPRVSSVNGDIAATNLMVNRQIEVSLLIISPMLTFLVLALPVLMPLLYSHSFAPVVAMAQVAALSMYFKAMTLPIAYVTLARGDSVAYFLLETAYDALLVGLVIVGYNRWGLLGTGFALTASYILDLCMVYVYAHLRYRYSASRQVCQYALLQLPLGFMAYAVTFVECRWLYIILGAAVIATSAAASVYILHRKTSLWNKLIQKYLHRHG